MKLVKVGNRVTIILSDGTLIMSDNFTNSDVEFVLNSTEDEVKRKYIKALADYEKEMEKVETYENLDSKILSFKEGVFTIPEISQVSVPKYLVDRILGAEMEQDEVLLNTYLNFWTLACQNPNAEARNHLLWFLETHGFKILPSGLFVAYRNVVKKGEYDIPDDIKDEIFEAFLKLKEKKMSPKQYTVVQHEGGYAISHNDHIDSKSIVIGNLVDVVSEDTIDEFTDNHTRKMSIKKGVPVRMDRAQCDEDSSQSCSRGLHLAKKDWSGLGSFGDTTIMCLCNPVNVVAVPKEDTYGKIRTCEYFPVKEVEKGPDGKIIEDFEDGEIEMEYFTVSYDGVINNNNSTEFKIDIPVRPDINYTDMKYNLMFIKDQLANRNV